MYIRFSDQDAPLKKRQLAAETVVDLIGRRIEAANHVRAQSRRSVVEVTAHEWVKGQSTAKELAAAMFTRIDKLNRLRQRGEEAIDLQLLPLSAILKSTLDTTFGLPFVLREIGLKMRSCGQYFSSDTPTEEDLRFVDRLLECCGRSVLAEELVFRVPDHSWERISDASREIAYSFSSDGIAGICTHKRLIDAELEELLRLVKSLDRDTVEARWPAAEVVNRSRDAYRGVLGVLTFAPRELLRNAASHGDGRGIAFDVDVATGFGKNPTTIKCTVSNRLKSGANPDVPRFDVLTKFEKIRKGLPFLSEPVIEYVDNKFLASVTISVGGQDA